MAYPKCLYKDNCYLIVQDEAHHKGAEKEGWGESHAHITGLPDRYKGTVPPPVSEYTSISEDITVALNDADEEMLEKEMEQEPPTEEELQAHYNKMTGKKALRAGKQTKPYKAWKKEHLGG